MKEIVIYDSLSGNTEKIARTIASVGNFDIVKVDSAPLDLQGYDIMIIGTLNIRAHPSEKMINYIDKITPSKKFAIFITFGMPIWGQISSLICASSIKNKLEKSGSKFLAKFICPGYHIKYKTYKGRPSAKDLVNAEKFGKRLSNYLNQ